MSYTLEMLAINKEIKKLKEKLKIAINALEYYETKETCNAYECCGNCSDTYTAEKALEEIRP